MKKMLKAVKVMTGMTPQKNPSKKNASDDNLSYPTNLAFNQILIGPEKSGKSTIVETMCRTNEEKDRAIFNSDYRPTQDINCTIKITDLPENKIDCQTWDVPGNALTFDHLAKSCYKERENNVVILCLDLSESPENMRDNAIKYLNHIQKNDLTMIPVVVIGTKADLMHSESDEIRSNIEINRAFLYTLIVNLTNEFDLTDVNVQAVYIMSTKETNNKNYNQRIDCEEAIICNAETVMNSIISIGLSCKENRKALTPEEKEQQQAQKNKKAKENTHFFEELAHNNQDQKLVLLGRPNSGKSEIFNRSGMLKEEYEYQIHFDQSLLRQQQLQQKDVTLAKKFSLFQKRGSKLATKNLYLALEEGKIFYTSYFTKELVELTVDNHSELYRALFDAIQNNSLSNLEPQHKEALFKIILKEDWDLHRISDLNLPEQDNKKLYFTHKQGEIFYMSPKTGGLPMQFYDSLAVTNLADYLSFKSSSVLTRVVDASVIKEFNLDSFYAISATGELLQMDVSSAKDLDFESNFYFYFSAKHKAELLPGQSPMKDRDVIKISEFAIRNFKRNNILYKKVLDAVNNRLPLEFSDPREYTLLRSSSNEHEIHIKFIEEHKNKHGELMSEAIEYKTHVTEESARFANEAAIKEVEEKKRKAQEENDEGDSEDEGKKTKKVKKPTVVDGFTRYGFGYDRTVYNALKSCILDWFYPLDEFQYKEQFLEVLAMQGHIYPERHRLHTMLIESHQNHKETANAQEFYLMCSKDHKILYLSYLTGGEVAELEIDATSSLYRDLYLAIQTNSFSSLNDTQKQALFEMMFQITLQEYNICAMSDLWVPIIQPRTLHVAFDQDKTFCMSDLTEGQVVELISGEKTELFNTNKTLLERASKLGYAQHKIPFTPDYHPTTEDRHQKKSDRTPLQTSCTAVDTCQGQYSVQQFCALSEQNILVICVDLSDSSENIHDHLGEYFHWIKQYASRRPVCIVGTKADLAAFDEYQKNVADNIAYLQTLTPEFTKINIQGIFITSAKENESEVYNKRLDYPDTEVNSLEMVMDRMKLIAVNFLFLSRLKIPDYNRGDEYYQLASNSSATLRDYAKIIRNCFKNLDKRRITTSLSDEKEYQQFLLTIKLLCRLERTIIIEPNKIGDAIKEGLEDTEAAEITAMHAKIEHEDNLLIPITHNSAQKNHDQTQTSDEIASIQRVYNAFIKLHNICIDSINSDVPPGLRTFVAMNAYTKIIVEFQNMQKDCALLDTGSNAASYTASLLGYSNPIKQAQTICKTNLFTVLNDARNKIRHPLPKDDQKLDTPKIGL